MLRLTAACYSSSVILPYPKSSCGLHLHSILLTILCLKHNHIPIFSYNVFLTLNVKKYADAVKFTTNFFYED